MTAKHWKLGIIGWPLGYSLSPVMQQAALKAAGLKGEYKEYKVKPEELEGWLKTEAPGLDGFNVTMPHKEAAFHWLESNGKLGDPEQLACIRAVNAVKAEGDHLTGWDTDGEGFLEPFAGIMQLKGKRVLLLGAGGAAKAIAVHLAREARIRTLKVWNRRPARAEELAELVDDLHTSCETHAVKELSDPETGAVDLIVNATPFGMAGNDEVPREVIDHLHEGLVAYDLVYQPRETKFVQEARRRGCQVITGDRMLAAQGAAAFQIWTGVPAATVLPAMKKALDEHFAA